MEEAAEPIGWLLSASGLAYALGSFSQLLIHFPRTRTLGHWLGWTWLLGLGLCVFVVLLFPAGRLPSRRWRPVAWAAGAGLAGWVLGNAFAPTITRNDPPVPNPVGVTGAPGKIFTVMVGATHVLRVHTPVAVAVATLAAAALFTPVRRWVQSRVDRRFNRVRYDADQIAAPFADRLKTRSAWARSATT